MLYPQLLVFETDGLLAALLRPLAEERRWLLREPRRADSCVRLLRRGHPAVLVLRLGSDVLQGLSLLERVTLLCPDAQVIVVGDTDNPELAGLAWHLGARYVLLPPQPRSRLAAVVAGLMDAAIAQRQAIPAGTTGDVLRGESEELPEASLEDE